VTRQTPRLQRCWNARSGKFQWCVRSIPRGGFSTQLTMRERELESLAWRFAWMLDDKGKERETSHRA